MRLRAAAVLAALGASTACTISHRATDPQETLPSLTEASPLPPAPIESEPPAALASEPAPASAATPPSSAARPPSAPAPAKRRVWGRVAITTAVISPAQLMGPELPLAPGYSPLPVFPEKLTFAVTWGILSVGEATLGVDKIVMFNGRPAYHLVSEARSNSFCDKFYPVRDLNESWLDARTLTSLGYSKKLREGRYFRDVWVLYDRDAGTFVERQTAMDGSFRIRVGTIPASVQDILSSVYYTRAQRLPDGGAVVVDVNTPDNWPLVVKVTRREALKGPAGPAPSVLVEPAMRREGLFIQKGKNLRLWFSDEVFFGHITALLREMV
jgi:hypothetical protein